MATLAPVQVHTPANLDACRLLLNQLLGANLYSREKMASDAVDPEALLLATIDGERVIGTAVCRLLYPEDADYYRAFGRTALELFGRHKMGSLEAVAVTPTRQRQGVGKRLTQAQMEWLAEQGCDVAVTVSWIAGGNSASAPMYERLGFVGTPPVADFYLEESVENGWTCPFCKGPCRCAGAMFYRELHPAALEAGA